MHEHAPRRTTRALLALALCLGPRAAGASDDEEVAPRERPPLLRRITVDGNSLLSDDEIAPVIGLKPKEPLDVTRVRRAAESVRMLYVEKGYYGTVVEWQLAKARPGDEPVPEEKNAVADLAARAFRFLTSPLDKSMKGDERDDIPLGAAAVDVQLHVIEGRKVTVRSIAIRGNHELSTDELGSLLRTTEHVPLADVLGQGLYREEVLAADIRSIGGRYEDRGFLDVQVGPPRIDFSADKASVSITIPVREGRQYRVGRVSVAGDLIDEGRPRSDDGSVRFAREQLLGRLAVRSGDVAGKAKIAQGVKAVAKKYEDRGYAYVNVTPETKLDKVAGTIDLHLDIQAGPRVAVEMVRIVGNDKTQDHVIRRELRLYEGEWYSAEKLLKSEARVRALGFFERVRIATTQGTRADRMVVVVEVKEKNTGQFQLGAGFSSAEGFVLNGSVAYNNFLGAGQRASVSASLSNVRRLFDLRFSDPYFLTFGAEPLSFSARAFNAEVSYGNFVRSATGGQLMLGYPVGRPFALLTDTLGEDAPAWLRPYVPDLENLHVFLAAGAERVRIDTPDAKLLPGVEHTRPRYTTGLEAGVVFDQRDNRLFPRRGYYLEMRAEVATPMLGAALLPGAEAAAKKAIARTGWREGARALDAQAVANDFSRFTVNGRFYFSFDEFLPLAGVVAKANVELGYLASDGLLPFENYYMGGIHSVRGYFPRSVSPVIEIATDEGKRYFRVGGNKQLLANLELEFPIIEKLGIRGVVFFDAGNVWGIDENWFYAGMPSDARAQGWDPRRDLPLGLYSSLGFGVRWFSPIGPLRFEWGVPLVRRPAGTPGMNVGDQPVLFEFGIGGSF